MPKESKESEVPEKAKSHRIHATNISKTNKNYPLLDILCQQSKKNYNSCLFPYRQQNQLERYLKECTKTEVEPDLDSLDPNKSNIPFLKILNELGYKLQPNFKSMPEYFDVLESAGHPSFNTNYDKLPATSSSCTLKLVDDCIKSHKALLDIYYAIPKEERNIKPGTFRPGFPKYKKATESQVFQIYDTRLERLSITTAKVIWPERIQAIIEENNLPNTDLIIQVPTNLAYEIQPLTKSIKESSIVRPCKYSLIRIVPMQNCFKAEVVYDKLTDISPQADLHTQRDHQYSIAQKSLAQAIELKRGHLDTELKDKVATERDPATKKLLQQSLVTVNKLKKTSITKIFNCILSKNDKPIQIQQPIQQPIKTETTSEIILASIRTIKTKIKAEMQAQSDARQAELLPKYTPGEDRQAFISKAIVFAGLDPGIINFCALTVLVDHKPENLQTLQELRLLGIKIEAKLFNGKPVRSQLKYLNYQLSEAQSRLKQFNPNRHTSNKIKNIYQKRNNILDNLIKQATSEVLKYCLKYHVQVLAVGHNKGWKQSPDLHKDTKTIFELIPFARFLKYLTFRLENQGILVAPTEESYTSQTSILDHEQPTKANGDNSRREQRGLFKSNIKIQINADINASYQMTKKIKPDIQYTNSLIDTKGSFFSTFNKQHKNKKAIKVEELTQQSKSIGNTKYYLYENNIAQHKIFPSKQQKFRPKYIRTFTLFLQETKPNKVA